MEIERIRCIETKTGRVRFIVETLANNPTWMNRHKLEKQLIEKPIIKEVVKEVVKPIAPEPKEVIIDELNIDFSIGSDLLQDEIEVPQAPKPTKKTKKTKK